MHKHIIFATIIAYVAAQYHHQPQLIQVQPQEHHEEQYAAPHYEFKYGVEDPHSGDKKSHHETRDGDVVKGEYSLVEADGTIRTVKYTADHHNGFNAQVIRSGHPTHSAPVAHAPVVPKVHHPAPILNYGHGQGHGASFGSRGLQGYPSHY